MTPEELFKALDDLEQNTGTIAVREKINGKWGSFFLSELPGDLAIKHAFRFLRENRRPSRVVDPDKPGNTPIICAMECGKTVGYINREEGDDFGEFYHCASCLDDRVDGVCGDCGEVKLVREFTDGDPDAIDNTTVDYYLCETCQKERDE